MITFHDLAARLTVQDQLMMAVRANDPVATALALDLGAQVQGAGTAIPLHEAAVWADHRMLTLLLDRGARPNRRTPQRTTALHAAAGRGQTSNLSHLLAHGTFLNARDRQGWTALHLAAYTGQANAVATLLDAGARPRDLTRPSVLTPHGSTPLMLAVVAGFDGYVDVLWTLLEHGADLDQVDRAGRFPLHEVARCGPVVMVRHLVELGADPDASDRAGLTPLHNAVLAHAPGMNDRQPMVEALLAAGADPCQADDQGQTPLALGLRRFPDWPVWRALEGRVLRAGLQNVTPPLTVEARRRL